jgi:hypothetical protein
MTQQQPYLNELRQEIEQLVAEAEQVQAHASRILNRYTALGGLTFFADFAWPADITETDLGNALYSVTALTTFMGGHGTNLHKMIE